MWIKDNLLNIYAVRHHNLKKQKNILKRRKWNSKTRKSDEPEIITQLLRALKEYILKCCIKSLNYRDPTLEFHEAKSYVKNKLESLYNEMGGLNLKWF